MSHGPKVVALVPAWNAASFIEATLAALAAQTYPNFEVLISVDLSTDDTASICRRFARHEQRFQVIVQRTRQGFVGNTRALLAHARGDYFFWAWHDDLLLPEYVGRLVPAMESSPRVASAFTDVELHHVDGRVDTLAYTELEGVTDPVERARRVLGTPDNWWLPHRGLFRPEHARRFGGFRRHWAGDYKADWPWAVHMALLGEHVRVPGVLCRKFFKPTSLSASWKRNAFANVAVTLSCSRELRRARLAVKDELSLQLTLARVATAFVTARYLARRESPAADRQRRDAAVTEQQFTAPRADQ